MKVRISAQKIGTIFMLMCAFFLSGHALYIVSNTEVKLVVLLALFLSVILIKPRMSIKFRPVLSQSILFILVLSIGMILSQALYWNQNPPVELFMLLGRIIAAYAITQYVEKKEFSRVFCSVTGIVTIVALIVHFLVDMQVPVPNYSFVGLNGFIHHTIGICTWNDLTNELCGPFWETGLYSSIMLYAFFLETCYTGTKPRRWIIFTLVTGILVAGSTAGYLLLALMTYIVFTKGTYHKIRWDVLTLILVVAGVLFSDEIAAALYNWKPEIFWKLTEKSLTLDTRLNSPLACLSIFFQNPLTGFGRNYATELYNASRVVFRMDSLTSTSTFMLAAFGVSGISYTWFMCRGVMKQKQFAISTRLLLLALFLMIVNKEPHTSNVITYIIMFYLNQED